MKKKGIDIPHYDKLVEGGTLVLEGLAMVADVPNRDEQFDKLEDSCREALRALVDIKPEAFYSLAFSQAPTIVKQLMYVPEIGEQIVSGNGLDFDKIEENAKENYKNLLIGGQYCFTDMLASVVKLPRICSHLNKIRQKRIETQIDDFLQSQGSLEDLAQIKVDRLKSGFSGIGNTITDATTDFINQDKDEKYQTAGYAVTFLAMLADSAFSIMDAVKASKATKAVESVETVVESGEEIAEVAGEGTEVLAEGEAAVEGGKNLVPTNPAEVESVVEGSKKSDVLSQNRANGRAFEQQEFAKFSSQNKNAVEQITIKTSSGTKTRVDAIGLDSNGNVVINEFKSSLTAPLTKNQAKAFPEIFESGGTVVGNGKGIFTNGYTIPKGTNVNIIRPR